MSRESTSVTQSALRARRANLDPARQALLERRLLGLGDIDQEHGRQERALPYVVPAPEHRYEPFPLTDVQQAYWVGRQPGFELGNVPSHGYLELEIGGAELDPARFTDAWRRLVERHDKLRSIVTPDGQQQVLETVPAYQPQILDLRGRDPDAVAVELAAIREQLSHQVFETHRWPLFDIRLALLDGQCTRLFISIDLLVADIWSLRILIREWLRLYLDPAAALPRLELTYRDYVLAKATLKDTEDYARARDYWMTRLSELPPPPQLPLAKSPAAVIRPRFVCLRERMPARTWKKLRAVAAGERLTPSALLLAAFVEILAAWSKSARFSINVPLFDRLPLHPQVNDIVGCFTSLTFVAVDHSVPAGFASRARSLQQQVWEGMGHRAFSGVEVLREIARRQGRMTGGVIPIVFSSTTLPQEGGSDSFMTALPGNVVYSVGTAPQVWLDYQVWPEEGGLAFTWNFVEELFPPGLMRDMLDAYCRLLRRLADDVGSWHELSREHVLPDAHRTLQAALNATEAADSDGLLHGGFEAQAQRSPERPAVVSARSTLSYGQIERSANHLALRLRRSNVEPQALVAVVMEKGWEQVVATLGILKAGGAYLPIDPETPKSRMWHLLKSGNVRVVLTQPWVAERIKWPQGVQQLVIDGVTLAAGDVPRLEPIQRGDDLAYVIYTSGSTGTPKGVMVTHRGIVNNIGDINQRFAIGPRDRVLASTTLCFDVSVWETLGTLAAGATVIMPEASGARDAAYLAELMRRERITVWSSVPTLMQMLVEEAAERGGLSESVRLVLLNGDWIPPRLPDQIRKLAPNARVVSMGGNTEASIWSFEYPIEVVDPSWNSIPYGKPMKNQRAYVLNAALEARPVWVPGELYLAGTGLARGYWDDEEKTKATFVTHPRSGERLYRTGDWARYLPDGNLQLLGREDLQVKVRGYRIELGEIEAALRTHPGVEAAAVLVTGDRGDNRKLVAHVARNLVLAPSATELRDYLRERLPAYMVPSTFLVVDSLPLTPNGKIDRGALASDESVLVREREVVEPRTPTEAELQRAWSRILGLEAIGVRDDFFAELGGDSLQATLAVAEIRRTFGAEIGIRAFFEQPTIEALASSLDAGCGTGRTASAHSSRCGDPS